jgi:hypothetical protein
MSGYSQAQIDALRTAIAMGVTQVSYQGRTTTYRSLQEMRDTLAMMERSVSSAAFSPRRTSFATFRRD